MAYPSVVVIGGSGFIGSRVVGELSASGRFVLVPTRRYEHARHLLVYPTVEVVEADVHDAATLRRLFEHRHAVVNLVGILHSRTGPRGSLYGPDFARQHVELPKKIVTACAASGIRRYLHMSALGADKTAPSMYLRSKADGEAAACSEPAVNTTIFRPSVVFGEEDHFLNLFAKLQKFLPLMLLGGADAKFQPVYVGDVAKAFARALDNDISDKLIGAVVELVGPRIYTLRELVKLAGWYAGHPRPVIGLPAPLARLQAMLLEHMPGGPLMSRDNLDSMKTDNVATMPPHSELGITPTYLEAVAQHYLGLSRVPHRA
jgi:uncharacterized protein YbjT (DUF2867 family)